MTDPERTLPANARTDRPLVAIVGRPNVGKSTLFNRLVGKRLAIVEDVPGVTRDRHYADGMLLHRNVVFIDTGGFDPESDDPMKEGIALHVRIALEEADVVVCVLDATTEAMPADREAIRLLRNANRPSIVVANKADSPVQAAGAMSLYELGVDHVLPVSALHGIGFGELEDAILALLPPALPVDEGPYAGLDIPHVAVVGRPNAGKSSLTNRLLGEERQLVDERPGTTIDSIDSLIEVGGQPIVLVDTAGIRRKRAVQKERGIEGLSVMKAIRAMERSDAVVLMIDAHDGVAEQDAKLVGLAVDRGRALVIGLNKADLMDRAARDEAKRRTKEILKFAPWAKVVVLSAKTGRGARKVIEAAREAIVEHRKRIGTAEVNRFFDDVLDHHPPPVHKNKAVRLFYVTQAAIQPPTFIVMTNEPKAIHWSYERYVINALRERFGFEGTPIRVFYRARKRRDLNA